MKVEEIREDNKSQKNFERKAKQAENREANRSAMGQTVERIMESKLETRI